MQYSPFDVLIIGAGASGLFCAATATSQNRRVLLLEKNSTSGKKLLLAGGGKGNITNLDLTSANYVGNNPEFTQYALDLFPPERLLEQLKTTEIAIEEREYKQIFCRDSAQKIRDLLLNMALQSGLCTIKMESQATHICITQHTATRVFTVQCGKDIYQTAKIVLATGSTAWPQCGADDSGLHLAKQLGHHIFPLRPVLAPLILEQSSLLMDLAGISIPVTISCSAPDSPSFTMPLLFTHRGLSGPAILQISCYWQKGMELVIDFLPGQSIITLMETAGAGKHTPYQLLARLLPERLCRALLPEKLANRKSAELSRAHRECLHTAVHAYSLTPLRNEGMRRAEACAGGVNTAEVDPYTMESLLVPGLYFCGEILDIAGQLGGYNLHWAWASGYCAGISL